MDALLRRLLRPTLRASRLVTALVVVALVGWLGVTAGHLHLPGEDAHEAHVHHGTDGHVHVADPGLDGADDHPAGERVHPCSLCASLDRLASPASAVAYVVTVAPSTHPLAAPAAPVTSLTTPTVYRSRAPPAA